MLHFPLQIIAEEPGVYKFLFDNQHGKVWSKTVRYRIQVVDPVQTAEGLNGVEEAEVAEEA